MKIYNGIFTFHFEKKGRSNRDKIDLSPFKLSFKNEIQFYTLA